MTDDAARLRSKVGHADKDKLEEKIVMLGVHEQAQTAAFRDFVVKVKGTKKGNVSVLDKTSILSGAFMGSAVQHMSQNIRIILAGGGFKRAGHAELDRKHNEPLSNLFVSILQHKGKKADKFADNTGTWVGIDFKI